jgi:hypothetical protein
VPVVPRKVVDRFEVNGLLRAIEILGGLGIDRLWWKRSHCPAYFCVANDKGILGECQAVIALVGDQGRYVLATIISTRRDGENETSPTPSIVVSVMGWRNSGFQGSQGRLHNVPVHPPLKAFWDSWLNLDDVQRVC